MSRSAEIVVVGAGPGGLSAAAAAAQCGAQVTLIDAHPVPGGQYYHQPPDRFRQLATSRQKDGRKLWQHVTDAGVKILSDTTVWNLDGKKTLSIYGPNGINTVRAQIVILSTGAYERTAAFPGWTLPGVITAGAAQILLYHRVKPGLRVLAAGTGPLQLVTAANLVKAGIDVVSVLEAARITPSMNGALALLGQWGRIHEGLRSISRLLQNGVPYRIGWGIVAAHGTDKVEGAIIARLDAEWRPVVGSEREVTCDTICTGYGLIPFNALARMAGAEQTWSLEVGGEILVRDETMQTTIPGVYAIGDGAGIGGYRMAMVEGAIAGAAAAIALQKGGPIARKMMMNAAPGLRHEKRFQRYYASLFTPRPGLIDLMKGDTIVCRCESVARGKIDGAIRSGACTLQEIKAITRCGMGECQGRVCGPQIALLLSEKTGKSLEAIGAFSARPPIFPIPAGSFLKETD